MEMLRVTGNNTAQHIYLFGDKKKQIEPGEFTLHFPGGHIIVSRCSDGTYWAHTSIEADKTRAKPRDMIRGEFLEGRIDCTDVAPNKMDIGDLDRDDCYHIALHIGINHKNELSNHGSESARQGGGPADSKTIVNSK